MDINRNNYGEYFLDYWENNLSDDQKEILHGFLEANPDLKEEFHSFELFTLNKDGRILFPDKHKLKKKAINIAEFEEKCIAYHEGDLDSGSKKELVVLIGENELLSNIFNTYSSARLQKDHTIIFEMKDRLKRSVPFFIKHKVAMYRAIAAAAAILILISTYFMLRVQENVIQDEKEILSVYMIPVKESRLTLEEHPENDIARMETVEALKTQPIFYSDYEEINIEYLPTQQIQAIETGGNTHRQPEFMQMLYFDDQFLAYNIPVIEKEKKKRNAFGRIAGNIRDRIKNFFSPAKELFETDDNNLFWNIAGTGVNGYNLLTNNSYELVRYMNEEGKTESVKLIDNDEEILLPAE